MRGVESLAAALLDVYPTLQQIEQKWRLNTLDTKESQFPDHSMDIYQEILEQQRQWLIQKNHEKNTLSEEVVRRHPLYLEEEKLKFL